MKKANRILAIAFFVIGSAFTFNELNAAADGEDDYVICPGWGHKCISVTKDTWVGEITVPVYLKGKDRSTIEFTNQE